MKILSGRQAKGFREAVELALNGAGVHDMSTAVADLFASALDTAKLANEAGKSIKSTVHNRYGKKATWYGDQWFVPVPRLGFKTEPIPQLIITVQPYLVSPTKVDTGYGSYSLTLVGAVDKAVELTIPMIFLYAIIKDDLARFRLVAKDSSHSSWEVPGVKAVELPNDFVGKLSQIFKQWSVTMWLESFGSQGRTVAPQIIGSLLGLQSMGAVQPIPIGQQAWSREIIINDLVEGLDYKTKEAEEMFNRGAPYLRADHTREEALRIILQQAGKGEY